MMKRVTTLEFRSDNAAGVAPHIMDAVVEANAGSALAYGDDELTALLQDRVSEVFEREALAFPVVSGTAANALALSAMCPPWGAVLCSEHAHILVNEAAATSMFSGGAALLGLPSTAGVLAPSVLGETLEGAGWGDPHNSQPAVLSITQATELGGVYDTAEIAELARIARSRRLRTHLDGARLANALVATGATPAEMTWRAGVTTLSLGGIKNGTISADAIVTFDAEIARELKFRLKRAGHVASKMRFQSIQLLAYLDGDRWLRTAAHANRAMAVLATGLADLGYVVDPEPQANIAFVTAPAEDLDRWAGAGVLFYRMAPTTARFVTSFATTDAEVDEALARISGL